MTTIDKDITPTTSTTSTTSTTPSPKGGVNIGIIIGCIVVSLICFGLIAGGIFFFWLKIKNKNQYGNNNNNVNNSNQILEIPSSSMPRI